MKKYVPSGPLSSPTSSPPQSSSPVSLEPTSASWLPRLNLDADDKAVVAAPDGWLNDKIVDAVNSLVRQQLCTDTNQSTLLANVPSGFSPVETECIQVLHDQNHWVATACIASKVLFSDSLGSRCISPYVATQLKQLYARLINSERNQLRVEVVPCPRQTNGSDCGVYSSAVAVDWAMGSPLLPVS